MSQQHGPCTDEFRLCSVANCPKKAVARGMCDAHYHKAWKADELPPREHTSRLLLQRTWVTKEIDRELRKRSRQSGRTCSDLIRTAVEQYLGPVQPA